MMNWIQYLHLQVCCIFLSYKNQHPSLSLKNCPQQSCKTNLMLVNSLNRYFPQQDIHDLTLYRESLYHLHLWKTTFLRKLFLVGRVFVCLFVCFSIRLNISSFLSWTVRFLLRSPLIFLREILFCEHVLFSCCLQNSPFFFITSNVSWGWSFWMTSEEWPISYMNLDA